MSRIHLRMNDPKLDNDPVIQAWLRFLEVTLGEAIPDAELDDIEKDIVSEMNTFGSVAIAITHRADTPYSRPLTPRPE